MPIKCQLNAKYYVNSTSTKGTTGGGGAAGWVGGFVSPPSGGGSRDTDQYHPTWRRHCGSRRPGALGPVAPPRARGYGRGIFFAVGVIMVDASTQWSDRHQYQALALELRDDRWERCWLPLLFDAWACACQGGWRDAPPQMVILASRVVFLREEEEETAVRAG